MSEAKDPRDDDHIEELLSQLQGIFGKLSHSEEEESQAKMDPPGQIPTPPVAPPETVAGAPPTVPDAPLIAIPLSDSVAASAEVPSRPVESSPVETPMPPAPPVDLSMLPMEADKSAVYSLIFYPPNRESEAKILTEKVETMTPRFTKVAFQIKVVASIPIDTKGDPRETVLPHVKEGIRAVFVMVDRPMEEVRRKILTAGLEPRGVYVHEVPAVSVEKKAFYTDLLLGMVFFYDSLKSGAE